MVAALAGICLSVWGLNGLLDPPSSTDRQTLPAATGRPLSPWRHTAADPAPDDAPAAEADRTPPVGPVRAVVRFDGPVIVHAGGGLDLDHLPPQATRNPSPDADLDLRWTPQAGLSVGPGRLFVDQGLPEGAAARCTDRIADGRDGVSELVVFPGDQLCLNTSQGRTSWLRVGEGAGTDDELTLQVTVWEVGSS